MNESTTVSAMTRYVELFSAAANPGATAAGSLLRDYLAILAFHLDRPGADRSATAVGEAIAALSGLLMQGTVQVQKDVTVTAGSAVDGLAGILASEWGTVAGSPDLRSLAGPLIARLGSGGDSVVGGDSFDVTFIVLQRPANDPPTLGFSVLSLRLRQDAVAPPSRSLFIRGSHTTYTVVDQELADSQEFIADLRSKGLIADLATTPGYFAIPLS
jgi:hypothetical protein